ncbi:MAG: hypothetical protein ACREAM_09020 [Blastocatellia bacterium]
MTLSRRKYSSPRIRVFSYGWLDSSSAWAQDEYAVIPPVASEPYDWMPEDDAFPFPQLIPIPPPILDGSARAPHAKHKDNLWEASMLIPIEKVATGRLVRRNSAHLVRALPAFVSRVATGQPAGVNGTSPRRKHLASSVLLLLFSVIALFVFAYIAQKYGR